MGEEFLYHYTTLDKLALILRNRTIRLNPLDKMDDLQENMTSDVKNFGRIFFASSSTEEATESIPMWKMYASMESGVRIGLPKNPFKRYPAQATVKETGELINYDVLIPLEELYQKGIYTTAYDKLSILVKMDYNNDINLLEPKILGEDGKSLVFSTFGKYKSEYWKFQKEWRYLLWFDKPDPWNNGNNFFEEVLAGNVTLPINYFDLKIDDGCFNKMEVLISPKMSEGNRILLDTLIKRYNPTALLKESVLRGKM